MAGCCGTIPARPLEFCPVGKKSENSMAEQSYVEQREGMYYVAGTRVSLDSIVYAFLEGHSAEGIQQSFSLLTLEQVYGAITYYLAHREIIDAYLQEQAAAAMPLKSPCACRR